MNFKFLLPKYLQTLNYFFFNNIGNILHLDYKFQDLKTITVSLFFFTLNCIILKHLFIITIHVLNTFLLFGT